MKKITIRYANVICLLVLAIATLVGLIVCSVLPDYDFSGDEYSYITKIFFIIVFSLAFGGCFLVFVVFTTREVKLVKRLNKFRKTLEDDALFFRGKLIVPGCQRSSLSVGSIIVIVLFGILGVFFWTVIRACKGVPSSNRIFLLDNDGLYAFELTNTNSIYCKRGSIKNPAITTDGMNVIMRFRNRKISHLENDIIATLCIKKSTMTSNELKQRLEDLYLCDNASNTLDTTN